MSVSNIEFIRTRAIRGGLVKLIAQAANFAIRIGSLMVLARLLDPKDFGLVGMVTAVTGILALFRDFGLSSASVQRETITSEQTATMFWINLIMGAVLMLVTLALAPALAAFYGEPRLLWVTGVISLAYLFNGAGVQHLALMQREMRFVTLAMIDMFSLVVGASAAIGAALAGYGYWALVVMTVSMPLTTTVALWFATAWVPGPPRRATGIWSMIRFGGAMTLNGVLWYVASNCDKVLLGRFWGADATGLYFNASQLIRTPIDNLNGAVGDVAFSAFSRVREDPERLRRYFLKGYSLVVALTLPVTVACAVFADDIVGVMFGPRWSGAAEILRILAPTILIFAVLNPLGWLLNALGLVDRGLHIAFVFPPLLIAGVAIALPGGPQGVAFAYTTVMAISVVPICLWAVRGTVIRVFDVLFALSRPLACSIAAAALGLGAQTLGGEDLTLWPRFVVEVAVFGVAYLALLLFVAGQKSFYADLLRGGWRYKQVK